MTEVQRLKKKREKAASELGGLLSADQQAALCKWLDAVDNHVHQTRHGNYPGAFNDLREKLGR